MAEKMDIISLRIKQKKKTASNATKIVKIAMEIYLIANVTLVLLHLFLLMKMIKLNFVIKSVKKVKTILAKHVIEIRMNALLVILVILCLKMKKGK